MRFLYPRTFKGLIIFNEKSEKKFTDQKYFDFFDYSHCFDTIYSSKKGGGSYEKESFEKN